MVLCLLIHIAIIEKGGIIRSPCPHCPGIGNRKSVFKGTTISVVETFIINPLECIMHRKV